MRGIPDELRLFIAIATNAIVLICAARMAQRRGVRDKPQVALDAMLAWYLVQYISVALPGVLGLLNVWSMIATAALLSAAMLAIPRLGAAHSVEASRSDRRLFIACFAGLCAFVVALIYSQRWIPAMANDALTYHLPAAVQWLQTGRLGLFETWFFNPANTYSPLAGSTFSAWLLAPVGNDALARFVEAPALLLLFLAINQLGRNLGAPGSVAALVALAACCSRPFINQIVLAKDDLFVAAFFTIAVSELARSSKQSEMSPLRIGVSLGLLLATKYTALLALPVLMLAIDAPHRAGWKRRDYLIAFALIVALAGPWFIRNLVLTGNPLFPIRIEVFGATLAPGLFTTTHAQSLRDPAAIFRLGITGFSGLQIAPAIVLLLCYALAIYRARSAIIREPLRRLVLLGPPVMFGMFILASPYPEVRFVYPAFVLLFACALLARVGIVGSVAMLLATFATSYKWDFLRELFVPLITFTLVAGALVTTWRWRLVTVPLIATIAGALVYVHWPSYLATCRTIAPEFWRQYGPLADAWTFVRDKLPPGETIAYSNTHFVYPLTGFELDRRAVYAPVARGVQGIADLAPIESPLTGDEIPPQFLARANQNPDVEIWSANLRSRGVKFVFVATPNESLPPELRMADQLGFERVFHNKSATIFKISR